MAASESKTSQSIIPNDINNVVQIIFPSQKLSKLCHDCFNIYLKEAILYLYLEYHKAKADDFTGSVRF